MTDSLFGRRSVNRKQASSRNLATRLEALEDRKLLAIDLVMPFPEMTVQQWTAHIAESFQWRHHEDSESTEETNLQSFASQEDLQAAIEAYATEYWEGLWGTEVNAERPTHDHWHIFPWQDFGWRDSDFPRAVELEIGDARTFAFAAATGRTNVAVGGVDELDQVEITAEGFLFAGKQNSIEILDISNQEDIQKVATIETHSYRPQFLLSGDRLVVREWDNIRILDVSDRANPNELSSWTFDGHIQDMRLIDGKLLIFTQDFLQLPPPQVVYAEGVDPDSPVAEVKGELGRFETAEEYFARISTNLQDAFLPEAGEGTVREPYIELTVIDPTREAPEPAVELNAVGEWEDITIAGEGFTRYSTGVIVFDVLAETPTILDSESVFGIRNDLTYVDADSIYLADELGWRRWNPEGGDTEIVKLGFDGNDIGAQAAGMIDGDIIGVRTMDEHDGDLRVVTRAADLFVLRQNDSQLEVIGELRDMADGQMAFGAYFDGDTAVVTTSEVDGGFVLPIDPLHGIDLSDPTNPVELSELFIPGVNNSLRYVGNNHFIGVGYFQDEENATWSTQVSLYDVSDLSNPEVVANWIDDSFEFEWFFVGQRLEEQAITFDLSTSTLLLGTDARRWDEAGGALAFQVDLTQEGESKLEFLGHVTPEQFIDRAYVVDNAILTVSQEGITLVDLNDIDHVLDFHSCEEAFAADDVFTVQAGETISLEVLNNDNLPEGGRIVEVEFVSGQNENAISIAADGQSLMYQAPDLAGIDTFNYRVETMDGQQYSAMVTVMTEATPPPPPPASEFSLTNDEYTVTAETEVILDVLDNDNLPEDARIIGVSDFNTESAVEIAEDGKSLRFDAPFSPGRYSFDYAVELPNGQQLTAVVTVNIVEGEFNNANVDFLIRATDELGNEVFAPQVGDTLWIELSADRTGFIDDGVFQAIFNVEFDTDALQVVGEPETLNGYDNGVRIERSESGFAALGGFNGIRSPGGGPNAIVRFQVQVAAPGDFQITASPLSGIQNETLIYGSMLPVDPANVTSGILNLSVAEAPVNNQAPPEPDTDVNGDGTTSPLDALMVIDHLNQSTAGIAVAEGESMRGSNLDVNFDGRISAMDALLVIQKLNEIAVVSVGPEGEASAPQAAPTSSFPVETGTDPSSLEEELRKQRIDALAAAYAANWDLNRRDALASFPLKITSTGSYMLMNTGSPTLPPEGNNATLLRESCVGLKRSWSTTLSWRPCYSP